VTPRTLAVHGDTVYWTDEGRFTIEFCQLDGSGRNVLWSNKDLRFYGLDVAHVIELRYVIVCICLYMFVWWVLSRFHHGISHITSFRLLVSTTIWGQTTMMLGQRI